MIINLKSQTDLSGFYVVYEGSTNLEKKGWYGIAHLMEHLVCKNFDHLQEDFDRDGIAWNAYTSSNEIVFYMTGLEEKISKWKGEFLRLLGEFNVTKEQFENERKIVLEEYMDAFSDQTQIHQMNLNRKLFNDYDPIGLKEDLENMKFLDCLNFYDLQYSKPTKIINVSKGKDFKNREILFSDRTIDRKIEYGNFDNTLELGNTFKDKASLLMLSPIIEEDFAYINYINAMLSLGLKSPLYQEIREKKGLVYYIQCYLDRMNKQGIINISTQTSNKNFDEVVKTIKEVISNPDKYLTQERFDIVKDFFTIRLKKQEILRYNNVNDYIGPSDWSINSIIEKVDMKKIREVYDKYYIYENFYISNDKNEFK